MLFYSIALLCLLGMVLTWHHAQRAALNNKGFLRIGLVILSILLFCGTFQLLQVEVGTEFAWFLSLFHFSWLAWVMIASNSKVKINARTVKTVKSVPAEKSWWYKSAVLMLAGPVALVGSILMALMISRWLIDSLENQWVLTFILVPFIWGLLATWFAADNKLIRPLVITLVFAFVSYWWIA